MAFYSLRLNPSYTGIWSRGLIVKVYRYLYMFVLTLLILEFGLGVCSDTAYYYQGSVLTLLILEFGLGESLVLTDVINILES